MASDILKVIRDFVPRLGLKHAFDKIDELIRRTNLRSEYKEYIALVTQVNISDPTVAVLSNSLGGTPVWTYSSNGVYLATLNGAWTSKKTYLINNPFVDLSTPVCLQRVDTNVLNLSTSGDSTLTDFTIEVRVYQ